MQYLKGHSFRTVIYGSMFSLLSKLIISFIYCVLAEPSAIVADILVPKGLVHTGRLHSYPVQGMLYQHGYAQDRSRTHI